MTIKRKISTLNSEKAAKKKVVARKPKVSNNVSKLTNHDAKKWKVLMKLQDAIEKRHDAQNADMSEVGYKMKNVMKKGPSTQENRNKRYSPLLQKYYKTANTHTNFINMFIAGNRVLNAGWRQKNLRLAEKNAKTAMRMQNEIDGFTRYRSPNFSPKHRQAVQKLWNEYSRLNGGRAGLNNNNKKDKSRPT